MLRAHSSTCTPPLSPQAGASRSGPVVFSLLVLGLCLLWTYWPTFATMADRWVHDPQYSHGFLVPVFAGIILWQRRTRMTAFAAPSSGGWALLLLGVVIRVVGTFAGIQALDAFSLLPSLAGLCLLLGGRPTLRWAWPAIGFLGFMLPLPFMLDTALAHPLQRLATSSCTYLLQTVGYPALAEGNIIYIDDIKLGIIGACSGLGMLMTFFALSTAVAILIRRPLADRFFIALSAIPIALIVNIVRITATGIVYYDWGQEAGKFLHDGAGWLMMPLALTLMWLEIQFLNRLLQDTPAPAPLPLLLTGAVHVFPYSNADPDVATDNHRRQPAPSEKAATVPTPGYR
jgi:exosortase